MTTGVRPGDVVVARSSRTRLRHVVDSFSASRTFVRVVCGVTIATRLDVVDEAPNCTRCVSRMER